MNKTIQLVVGVWFVLIFLFLLKGKCFSRTDEIPYKNTKPTKIAFIKVPPPPISREERIDGYVRDVSRGYNVSPELVQSIIYHESRYDEHARSGDCVGLMQINSRYHIVRAKRLGVTNLSDPYSNVLVGVDYLSELLRTYKDPALVLMIYNSGTCRGMSLYSKGEISGYARKVLAREKQLKAKKPRG